MKVRVGRRFTLTIPREIREALGIKEGDELEASVVDDALVLRRVKGLVEFIDSLEPRGRVEVFLEGRAEELGVENERVKELVEKHGR